MAGFSIAGNDGQIIIVRNASATDILTLPTGGASTIPFSGGAGGVILPPSSSCQITYYSTLSEYVITT